MNFQFEGVNFYKEKDVKWTEIIFSDGVDVCLKINLHSNVANELKKGLLGL